MFRPFSPTWVAVFSSSLPTALGRNSWAPTVGGRCSVPRKYDRALHKPVTQTARGWDGLPAHIYPLVRDQSPREIIKLPEHRKSPHVPRLESNVQLAQRKLRYGKNRRDRPPLMGRKLAIGSEAASSLLLGRECREVHRSYGGRGFSIESP